MYVFGKERLEDDFPKKHMNIYVVLDRKGYTSDSTAVDSYRCANVWHGMAHPLRFYVIYNVTRVAMKGENKRHR